MGNIILGIENQPIESLENFTDLVSSLKPKQKVTLLALDHRSGNTDYGQVMVR